MISGNSPAYLRQPAAFSVVAWEPRHSSERHDPNLLVQIVQRIEGDAVAPELLPNESAVSVELRTPLRWIGHLTYLSVADASNTTATHQAVLVLNS